ncbi:MAG: ATP-binding protein [Rubrivivax sp.]
MTFTAQRIVQARMAELADALAFADAFCAAQQVARDQQLRLTLVIEELFSNTVQHGHGGDAASPIRLALHPGTQGIELLYEDHAPAFDPLAWARDHAAAPQVDPHAVGGRGVLMVLQLSSATRYKYEDGCNRLWLHLPHR